MRDADPARAAPRSSAPTAARAGRGAAAGWGAARERVPARRGPVSHRMIDAIAPQPGHTVLELAAGPGDTGFLAAELIRPGGTLVCTRRRQTMLDVAEPQAAKLRP